MDSLFYPQSLAVIGVSENPENLPRVIAGNLLRFGYPGRLHLVGRRAGQLDGHPILASIEAIPGQVDAAVVLTPAETIPEIIAALGQKGARHAIIEAGGFAETSDIGEALGEEILAAARRWNMRLVGPNCIGIVNTANGICTVFIETQSAEIRPGSVSLISQSGAVVYTVADLLKAHGLGLNKSVSMGNKLDYQENDYLRYFLTDETTRTIFLYLEGINDGRGFVDLACRAEKPIVVYKANTTPASQRAASSHTAALANDDRVVEAALRQAGAVRARTFREMMVAAKGFALPPVRGSRLAVFTRSGGHGTVSSDLAAEFGFTFPPIPEPVIAEARQHFRADIIHPGNPFDLGTIFDFDSYLPILRKALDLMQVDAVLFICLLRDADAAVTERITRGFQALSQEYGVPVALCYATGLENIERLEAALNVQIFTEVYDAFRALAVNRDFTLFQERARASRTPAELPDPPPADAAARAREILAQHTGADLPADQALAVCHAYGFPVAPWAQAADPGEAVEKASEVGYPLALKLISPRAAHKSDVGGVILDIRGEEELRRAVEVMQARMREHNIPPGARLLLQRMAPRGREVILGGRQDPSFGPVVLFGLGGTAVEALQDVTLRLAPLDLAQAREMIEEIRAVRWLKGMRGEAPSDLDAAAAALARLSQLVSDLPEIAEIDLNPLILLEQGAQLVDARIAVKTAAGSASPTG